MKTFEHYTEKLSVKEKEIYVPWFIEGLRPRIGKDKSITNPKMAEGIKKNYAVDLSEVQIRKIIAYIRDNDLLPGLVATQKGYYVTIDPEEVKEYIESLESREKGLQRARQAMERYLSRLPSLLKNRQDDK